MKRKEYGVFDTVSSRKKLIAQQQKQKERKKYCIKSLDHHENRLNNIL